MTIIAYYQGVLVTDSMAVVDTGDINILDYISKIFQSKSGHWAFAKAGRPVTHKLNLGDFEAAVENLLLRYYSAPDRSKVNVPMAVLDILQQDTDESSILVTREHAWLVCVPTHPQPLPESQWIAAGSGSSAFNFAMQITNRDVHKSIALSTKYTASCGGASHILKCSDLKPYLFEPPEKQPQQPPVRQTKRRSIPTVKGEQE